MYKRFQKKNPPKTFFYLFTYMEYKKCNKCKCDKLIGEFAAHKTCKGGVDSICKICVTERKRLYREKNREFLREKNKEYKKINKEVITEKRKLIYIRDKEKIKEQHTKSVKKRMLNDTVYRLKNSIKSLISTSIRKNGFKKKSRTHEILGCSISDFKIYLESKFEPWMNWENKGLYNGKLNFGWDIDHVIPVSSAKTEEDLYKLNHYTNLQPLCSYINRYVKKDN